MNTYAYDFSVLSLVQTQITIWSGKAKFNDDEMPQELLNALPPKELAAISSKALVAPELINNFTKIRTQVDNHIANQGIRFLGCFLVSDKILPNIESYLNSKGLEFQDLKDHFMDNFFPYNQAWAEKFPEYTDVLTNAAQALYPKLDERFSFGYQIFKIDPSPSNLADPNSSTPSFNDLSQQIQSVPKQAQAEALKLVQSLRANTYSDDKQDYSKRSLLAVKTALKRIEHLSFMSSNAWIDQAKQDLNTILNLGDLARWQDVKATLDKLLSQSLTPIPQAISTPIPTVDQLIEPKPEIDPFEGLF